MKSHHVTRTAHQDMVLPIEAGVVMCPRQGAVDLERCWICPAYDGLSTGHVEGVICKADLRGLDVDAAITGVLVR